MRTLVEEHIKESNKDSHFILRMIAMAVSVAVFAYAAACLVLNVDTRSLGWTENGGVDYQVCLKPNDYFADECQPAGKQYVASLISDVRTTFKYNFRADDKVDYNYDYDVTTRLVATETNDPGKVLYENTETIVPAKKVDGQTGQSFNISEAVSINYAKYNNLVTQFRADYGLTINAYVVVSMNIKVQGKHAEFAGPLETSQKIAIKIPLSERTVNVNMESDALSNSGAVEEIGRDLGGKNLAYLIIAGIVGVIFLALLVTSICIFVKRENGRSDYEKELGRILHEYNQLIVAIERVPQIPKDKIIKVKSFDELLDARDTIQKPILHLELADDRSLFIIEDQDMAYVYPLASSRGRRNSKQEL